ncbi:MAG: hypothetical protein D6820_04840 [Lentisphaerae bacterium]|nr:MAG: hypothetical protein D6820_04840 [Lentisphaerota bacterium]
MKPEEAADAAEFFCGDPAHDTNGGVNWALKRVNGGVPEPIRIEIWELGNELDEYTKLSREEYVRRCRIAIKAVRSVVPQAQFAAHVAGAPWNKRRHPSLDHWRAWHRYVLQQLGSDIRWLVFHPYYEGVSVAYIYFFIDLIEEDLRSITGNRVKLYFSEHGRWPPRIASTAKAGHRKGKLDSTQTHSLRACLAIADFLLRATADPMIDAASCHAFYGGPWGMVRYAEATDSFYPTGILDLFGLLTQVQGAEVLQTTSSGPYTDRNDRKHPATFLAQAFRLQDRLLLFLLNKSPEEPRHVNLSLPGNCKLVRRSSLTAGSLKAFNTAGHRAIQVTSTRVDEPVSRSVVVPAKTLLLLEYVK